MIQIRYLIFMLFFATCIGCAQLDVPFFGKSEKKELKSEKSNEITDQLESTDFVKKGRIIDAQQLKLGKNIAIIPFKAGPGVEANERLDKIALMIVKGVADLFADDKSGKHDYFNVVTAENSNSADLVIKGYITQMDNPSKILRWGLIKNKKILRVEGKINVVRTDETIVIFDDHINSQSKNESHEQLGHRIGQNIGQFILNGVE